MITSGPLEPSDMPLFAAYPEPITVPLHYVENEAKNLKNYMEVDESGLYMLSKAVEEFTRDLMHAASRGNTQEIGYDSIAEYIHTSVNMNERKHVQFSVTDYFPLRVRFGDVQPVLFPDYGKKEDEEMTESPPPPSATTTMTSPPEEQGPSTSSPSKKL